MSKKRLDREKTDQIKNLLNLCCCFDAERQKENEQKKMEMINLF